jgi:hypothetical protein
VKPIFEFVEFRQQPFEHKGDGIGDDFRIPHFNVIDALEVWHEKPALIIIPDLGLAKTFFTD